MNVVHRLLQRVNRTEYWYGDDDEVLDREAVRVIQQLEADKDVQRSQDRNAAYEGDIKLLEDEIERLTERCRQLTKDRSEVEAKTIERCAQVAEDFLLDGFGVAAAIRALKDDEELRRQDSYESGAFE